MKKNNKIIILSKNENLINSIIKENKIKPILINEHIYNLEESKKKNNIPIYPIKLTKSFNNNEKMLFSYIIKKYLNIRSRIIIDTEEPKNAQPFENTNITNITELVNNDINYILSLLKILNNSENEIRLIFLIHKEKKTQNNFFTVKNCINKFIIEFMKNENNNKNIYINCISTENINLNYKNQIYPFKNKIKLKDISMLTKACDFIIKRNIKNKLIIV